MTNPRDDLIRLLSVAVGQASQLSADLLAEARDIMDDIQVPVRTVQALTWRAGFNPNQPRDEYGQWSETGAGGGLLSGLAAAIDPTPSGDNAKVLFEIAEYHAAQYGIPAERVDYSPAPYDFSVGDKRFTAAGSYHPDTGRITIYDSALTADQAPFLESLVAHESSHHIWHTVQEEFNDESNRIYNLPYDEQKKVLKADGTIREGYEDQYPAYAAMEPYRPLAVRDKLEARDGVTDYSRAYWEAYHNQVAGRGVTIFTAINETLAEIAALRAQGKTKGVSRLWLSYHKAMREAYAIIEKRRKAATAAAQARERQAPTDAESVMLAPHILYLTYAFEVVADAQADLASIWYPDGRHIYAILAPDGPQARAGFDPSQPRDEYGRWSETGAGLLHAGAIDYDAELAGEKNLPDELRDRMRIVYDVVRDMGGDAINVDYGGAGYPFTLNGQTFYAAASFNQDTMVIEVYDNVLGGSDTNLRATVAHEQSHYMYERAREELEREQWRIDDLPADAEVFEEDGYTVTPEYKDQFPVHDKIYKYQYGKTMQKLRKEDGVSPYSTEYWQELETWISGGVSAPNISFDLCINETLAEIAALRMAGNTKAIADIWEQYFADLRAAYDSVEGPDA